MRKHLNNLEDVITFGKHEGKTVRTVMTHDVDYLEWLMDKTDRTDFTDDAKRSIKEQLERSKKRLFPDEDWGDRD